MERDQAGLDRRRRADEIFAQVLEQPEGSRTQYLAAACSGDALLRAEVETLLRLNPEAQAWFDAILKEELTEALTQVSAAPDRELAPSISPPPASSLSEGAILSHYRIARRLGTGGAGEVFEAWDLALGRRAAVKVLRHGLSDEARTRLAREAGMVARLEHPAIATFFESGEVRGVQYLAMEFVEGETLRSRLRRGALPAEECFALASALLEALVHAHAAGILHRDIKPENIMLTSKGSVKLLDFGIAKAMETLETSLAPAGDGMTQDSNLTEGSRQSDSGSAVFETGQGAILGTLGYMAPEQLRGEAVGAFTDLFAIGAVLYEMLTGERAYPGRTVAESIVAILSRDVPAIEMPAIPAGINAVLKRALSREPAMRYETASDFLADLRQLEPESVAQLLPNTIAILDFEDASGDPENSWLGSGLAESLGTEIAKVPVLRLVPRARVLQVRAAISREQGNVAAVSFGRAAGCRWVLTGSFRRTGSELQLSTALIEVATSATFWSQTFEGDLRDLFAMRDRLAKQLADSLHVAMPLKSARTEERIDAFECYSRSMRFWSKLDRGTFAQAQEYFERAIALDPNHAPALAGLAGTLSPARWISTTDPRDLDLAVEYARRAIDVDPNVTNGRAWLGYARWRQGYVAEALEILNEGMLVEPGNPIVPYFVAAILLEAGRPEDALPMAQRAVGINSNMTPLLMILGIAHMELDQFTEARWTLREGWRLEQGAGMGWVGAGSTLAECLRRARCPSEAHAQCLKTLDFVEQSDHVYRDTARASCLCVLGRTALDLGNMEAAQVAFRQAVLHVRGRPRGCGMGHMLVQALAGQSRAGAGPEPYLEGRRIFDERKLFDFSWSGLPADSLTLVELALAARALGRAAEAESYLERARGLRSAEARRVDATIVAGADGFLPNQALPS